MKRLIIFLVRRRLGLKKYEEFTFVGQKCNAKYYFTESSLMKDDLDTHRVQLSSVSFNWIINEKCEIVKCN